MVVALADTGFSVVCDVSPSTTYEGMDGEGGGAVAERGIHVEEFVSQLTEPSRFHRRVFEQQRMVDIILIISMIAVIFGCYRTM